MKIEQKQKMLNFANYIKKTIQSRTGKCFSNDYLKIKRNGCVLKLDIKEDISNIHLKNRIFFEFKDSIDDNYILEYFKSKLDKILHKTTERNNLFCKHINYKAIIYLELNLSEQPEFKPSVIGEYNRNT